jgi:hypothetical protein
MLTFLGRKATVLLVLVAVLLVAGFALQPAVFSTLATALPALYVAFVGAHSWQQTKLASAPPKPEGE